MTQRLQWVVLTLALLGGCVQARVSEPVASAWAASAMKPQAAPIQDVTVQEAYALLTGKNPPQFIDVRTPEEYAAGHAKGTTLYPLDQLDAWSKRLPKDRALLIICRSGSRSMKAAQALTARGFTQITNIKGGTMDWEAQGLPMER